VLGAICALVLAANVAWADPALLPNPSPAPNSASAPASEGPYNWEGLYITRTGTLSTALGQTTESPLNGVAGASSASAGSSTGGIDSGAFSANWQSGSTVVGLEGDMEWTNQWTGAFSACGVGCSLNDRVRVPWVATLRARAGTAFDRLFVYGTGGLATVGTSDNLNAGGYGTMPNVTNFSTGNLDWTIGAGMEMALDKNVSAKLEYLYMPGSSSPSEPGSLFDSSGDPVKNNIVRGGINYRLPVGE
jgi:outer membrane immunogenic protein